MTSVPQMGHQGRQQRKRTWKDTYAARNPHRSKVNSGSDAHLERNNSAERRRRSRVILWRQTKRFRGRGEEKVCLWFACQLEPQNDRNAIQVRFVRSASWQGQANRVQRLAQSQKDGCVMGAFWSCNSRSSSGGPKRYLASATARTSSVRHLHPVAEASGPYPTR